MAVKYVLIERGNPLKPDNEKKWYAKAKSSGEFTLFIKKCTVTNYDY